MGTVKYPAQATPRRSSLSRVPENGTHGLRGESSVETGWRNASMALQFYLWSGSFPSLRWGCKVWTHRRCGPVQNGHSRERAPVWAPFPEQRRSMSHAIGLGCADCGRRWRCRTGASGCRVGLIAARGRPIPVYKVRDTHDCGCSRVEVVVVMDLSHAFREDRTCRQRLQTV
jgi:hypothetical protein